MGPLLNLRTSPAGKGLSQAKGHCGKAFTLYSQPGDRYTLQGLFHASLTVLYPSLSWASDREKTQKKEKNAAYATMVI